MAIKLRQMEGATLERLASEFGDIPGDVMEHRVASALGSSLPAPDDLRPPTEREPVAPARTRLPSDESRPGDTVRRIVLAPGVEMLVADGHPAWDDPDQFAALEALVTESLAGLRGARPPSESGQG